MDGLNQLSIPYSENQVEKYNGCLQKINKMNHRTLPQDTLMGVSLMEIPTDNPGLWTIFPRFVTCSDWVLEKYRLFPETANNSISVWASGIDTELFNDSNRKIEQDCFIYYKGVTPNQVNIRHLQVVESELRRRNLSYTTLKYGSYTEEQLRATVNKSRFCVLLVCTESQGIGQMEIMSMGCPIYVFNNQKIWKKRGQKFVFHNASSVPYFDKKCGVISEDMFFDNFDYFLQEIPNYTPREYITDSFTIKKCAQRYSDLVKGVTT